MTADLILIVPLAFIVGLAAWVVWRTWRSPPSGGQSQGPEVGPASDGPPPIRPRSDGPPPGAPR